MKWNKLGFLLVVLVVLALTAVRLSTDASALEATRSMEQLKGTAAPAASGSTSTEPVMTDSGVTASPSLGNKTGKPDEHPPRLQAGHRPSKGEPAQAPSEGELTPVSSPGEATSVQTAPTTPQDTASPGGFLTTTPANPYSDDLNWQEDSNRGKPKINIALTVISLLVVCVIAYGGLKIYSKFVSGDQQTPFFRKKLIQVKERHVLGPNKMLCVVELPDKVVLIGVTESEIKMLTELSPEAITEFEDEPREVGTPQQPTAASYLTDVLLRGWKQGSK